MIRCILFDVDDTLMDYRRAELFVLRALFAENGRTATAAQLEELWALSWHYWHEQHLEETARPEVQREYHARVHRAVRNYCAHMSEQFGLPVDAAQLHDRFNVWMGEAVTLYDDALPTLRALAPRFVLGVASNALAASQRARIEASGLPVRHLFFSEEMGCIKPTREFFARAAAAMGARPDECLMVGDSLASDVGGAKSAGLRACWLNRAGRPMTGPFAPDDEIASLHELPALECLRS